MSLTLNARQVGDVTVVAISGQIAIGEGSRVLCNAVHDLTIKGNRKILLNLGDVPYIDYSGIGELVAGFIAVARAGGALKLLSLTKPVQDFVKKASLYAVFDVYEDEAHAVLSFAWPG